MLTDPSSMSKDPRGELLQVAYSYVPRSSFLKRPVPQPMADALAGVIGWCCENADISISVHAGDHREFSTLKKGLAMFHGVEDYLTFSCDVNDEVALEEIGYFGEVIALSLTLMGLSSCWVSLLPERDEAVCDDCIVCAMPFGFPSHLTYRERLFPSVPHRRELTAAEMSHVSGIAPEWFLKGVECASKAPCIGPHDIVMFTCKGGEITAAPSETGGLCAIDLGIAKLHFEIAANNAVAFQTTGVLGSKGKGRWEWGNGASFNMVR